MVGIIIYFFTSTFFFNVYKEICQRVDEDLEPHPRNQEDAAATQSTEVEEMIIQSAEEKAESLVRAEPVARAVKAVDKAICL